VGHAAGEAMLKPCSPFVVSLTLFLGWKNRSMIKHSVTAISRNLKTPSLFSGRLSRNLLIYEASDHRHVMPYLVQRLSN
jgi:hypothetical protein